MARWAGTGDRLWLRQPLAGGASSEAAASSLSAWRKPSGSLYACCQSSDPVSYTHLRAHETSAHL
eukprot:2254851-Alexandrium_andersonii.AAC.1